MESQAITVEKQIRDDWQTKVMKAINEGNGWQFTASIYGDLCCRTRILELKIKELEDAITQILNPIGH